MIFGVESSEKRMGVSDNAGSAHLNKSTKESGQTISARFEDKALLLGYVLSRTVDIGYLAHLTWLVFLYDRLNQICVR